jgi:hypothetical protein
MAYYREHVFVPAPPAATEASEASEVSGVSEAD